MPEKSKKIISDMVSAKKPSVAKPVSRPKISNDDDYPDLPKKSHKSESPISEYYRNEDSQMRRTGCFLWFLVLVCVVALVLGIGGLFAHADVVITPKQFSGNVSLNLNFAQSHDPSDIFFATVTKTFSDDVVVPATGTVANESRATGTVKIYNTGVSSVKIPAGTIILSSKQIQYTIGKTIMISAAKKNVPGSATVAISAVSPGSDANADLDHFTFLETRNLSQMSRSTAATPTTGGASTSDAVADPAQILTATQTLQQEFSDPTKYAAQLSDDIPDGFAMLPISVTPASPVISNESDHSDGVHVIASETVTILIAKKSDIARAIGDSLSVDPAIPLTIPSLDGLSFVAAGAINPSAIPNQISARVTGTPTVFGDVDTASIKSQILGTSRSAAHQTIMALPSVQSVNLRVAPFWRRSIPPSAHDVDVTVAM